MRRVTPVYAIFSISGRYSPAILVMKATQHRADEHRNVLAKSNGGRQLPRSDTLGVAGGYLREPAMEAPGKRSLVYGMNGARKRLALTMLKRKAPTAAAASA